jgi:sensor histidine kinase YesM
MTTVSVLRSIKRFSLLNLGIITILMILFCPRCFLSLEGIISIYPEFIMSFFLSSALSIGGSAVDRFFDQRISWIEEPVNRLILTYGVYLVYSFIISYLLITAYILITVEALTLQNISWSQMIKYTGMPITIAFVIISIFISRGWLLEWRNAVLEAEQLKSKQLESQNRLLIDQLNPHFLFNSLNALTHLVYKDADTSATFIQQLSRIYRYVLDVQHEQVVSLNRELGFAESYLHLQKIRFGDSLVYSLPANVEDGYFLPPLSLQLLLENAIKHNVVSEQDPLRITIKKEGAKLTVSNNLQPKHQAESDGYGVGLKNIISRYGFLCEDVPTIQRTENEFKVELPLLILDT